MNEHTDKKRILVCHDEECIRLLLTEALKDLYDIETIDDGNEALIRIRNENFDLLIIDLMIPKINSISVISKIRIDNTGIPIIVLSVNQQMVDELMAKKFQINAVVIKPLDLKILKTKITELIGIALEENLDI
jgi:DNA-binding response OmpR family regulator